VLGGAAVGQVPVGGFVLSDVVAPTVTITPPIVTKISRVATKDTAAFSFAADEDYQAYQIRIVPTAESPVSAGTLVEQGSGGLAGATRNVDVTDDELIAAGASDAALVVKVFTQDLAGNWSA